MTATHFRMATICVLASLSACAPTAPPELAVRAVIEQAEVAAESRDVGAALELVSADYADATGLDRLGLQRYIRGYFALNPRIELLLQVQSIEFPEPNRARVALRIASVGRTQLDADQFRLELVDEDGNWRLLRAERVREPAWR